MTFQGYNQLEQKFPFHLCNTVLAGSWWLEFFPPISMLAGGCLAWDQALEWGKGESEESGVEVWGRKMVADPLDLHAFDAANLPYSN